MDFSAERLVALLAALLAAAAMGIAIGALQRARRQGPVGLSPELCLTLVSEDGGLRRLRAHSLRSERWWVDADARDLEEIDRALSMWEAVAWNAETGAVDRRGLLDVFGRRVVEVWEQAYPYVQARRERQPALWSSLGDLYVDAYDAGGATPAADRFPLATYVREDAAPAVEPDVEPDPEPVVDVEPEPEPEPEPVVAAEPEPVLPAAESDERLQLWAAALRDEARTGPVVDLTTDGEASGGRLSVVRPTVTAARAVPPTALEHVVDVEIHVPAEGSDPRS